MTDNGAYFHGFRCFKKFSAVSDAVPSIRNGSPGATFFQVMWIIRPCWAKKVGRNEIFSNSAGKIMKKNVHWCACKCRSYSLTQTFRSLKEPYQKNQIACFVENFRRFRNMLLLDQNDFTIIGLESKSESEWWCWIQLRDNDISDIFVFHPCFVHQELKTCEKKIGS